MPKVNEKVSYDDFKKLDIRVGKVIAVEELSSAKYTTHKLTVDFGQEIGQKITGTRVIRYSKDELIDKMVVGVLNLSSKQIGNLISEFLILSVPDKDNECVLVSPDIEGVVLGAKLY